MSAFATMSAAFAAFGLAADKAVAEHNSRITREDEAVARDARRAAWKRGEKRREARAAREAEQRRESIARVAAEDRRQFEDREVFDCDDIVKVSGVWVWRKGAHRGKPVGAKALAKRHIR